jgi:hypothetical protein
MSSMNSRNFLPRRPFSLARRWTRAAVAALMAVGLGVPAALAGHADSPDPTAVEQVPIVWAGPGGAACGGGTLVLGTAGIGSVAPLFVLLVPAVQSPACPAGTVLLQPGAPGTRGDGGGIALPLNAGDCAPGTSLLDDEVSLVGGTPPPSTSGSVPVSGGSLSLASGGSLTIGSSATTGGGVLTVSGGVLALSGGALSLPDGTVALAGGSLDISGGSLTMNGPLPSSGGPVAITGGGLSLSGGSLTLASGGTLTLAGGGSLNLGSGGSLSLTGPGSVTGGPVDLAGGTLPLTNGGSLILGGDCPSGGAAYLTLQAGLTNLPLGLGLAMERQASASGATVTVHKPPIPHTLPGIELGYALDGTGTPVGHLTVVASEFEARGIFYFFKHGDASHFLVPSGTPGVAELVPATQCRACG